MAHLLLAALVAGCGGGGTGATGSGGADGTGGAGGGAVDPCADPVAPEEVLDATSDPVGAGFTLAEALSGLPPGSGPLRAIIDTDEGQVSCELLANKAPHAVANFVGLARGRRPFLDPATGKWVKRRFYDGLLFIRAIPGFMVHGGDPLNDGTGGPGYEFEDEINLDLTHTAGTLSYYTHGPNTNGSQFFMTDADRPDLDGVYTIFGHCAPLSVIEALSHVPTGALNRPLTDLPIKTVSITRCAP